MSKTAIFFIGAVVGVLTPLLIDWLLFGTINPSH